MVVTLSTTLIDGKWTRADGRITSKDKENDSESGPSTEDGKDV